MEQTDVNRRPLRGEDKTFTPSFWFGVALAFLLYKRANDPIGFFVGASRYAVFLFLSIGMLGLLLRNKSNRIFKLIYKSLQTSVEKIKQLLLGFVLGYMIFMLAVPFGRSIFHTNAQQSQHVGQHSR